MDNASNGYYGYIVASVKTAGGALPVENAVVTIRDENGNILYVKFTDRSGQTPRLRVPAPPISNTESPDMPGPPFFNYNIDTDKEGFISVRNVSVPVYPGITSIQPVELLPVPEGASPPPAIFTDNVPPSL